MGKVVKKIIEFYQKVLSFDTGLGLFIPASRSNTMSVCRFYPTCSEYAKSAVEKHGVLKGIFLGALRILRCNPWTAGGHDPVK